MTSRLFLVERYDDTGIPGRLQAIPAPPTEVRLICAVRVPADDAVLALVEGADEQSTAAALTTAGWRIDRIIPATWIHPDEEGSPPQTSLTAGCT